MKMNRYVSGFIVLVVALFALSACQLAKERIAQEEAWIIGVFITSEHLDLIDRTLEGQAIPMRRGRPDFSALFQPGRLYATWDYEVGNFRFPDVEGIQFFVAASPPHVPNETTISHTDPGISGGHTHMRFGDNYRHVEMEGTVLIVPGTSAMAIVHMNPVFQTTDGSVFLTNGSAFSGHGLETEGLIFSTFIEETKTITENGVESTYSTSITINVTSMFAPTKIVLLQMDENSHIVMRTEFAPDEMPQTFYLEADTAYVIIETHRDRPNANERVARELITQNLHNNSQWISTFVAGEDGILVINGTEIIWP